MRMKTVLIFFGLIFSLTNYAHSEGDHHHNHNGHESHKDHDHSDTKAQLQKVGKDKLVIKVKGMVCAFCAQGITKNFNKQEQVKDTKVDLDKMEVTIQLKPGKALPEKVIKDIVTDAGFSYVGLKE